MQRKPKSEQARVEPKQKNVQKNANVHSNVHGDVHDDASQADNNLVVDDNAATSQASSCVVDTS